MPRDFRLELRGKKNDDGSFTAAVYDDGKQVIDSAYIMERVPAADIRELYDRALEKYGKGPEIAESLIECFPAS